MIRVEVGWIGMFTREHARGALRNGTRVIRVRDDIAGNPYSVGALGTILGSVGAPALGTDHFYFVEWDDEPRVARGCVGRKLRAVASS